MSRVIYLLTFRTCFCHLLVDTTAQSTLHRSLCFDKFGRNQFSMQDSKKSLLPFRHGIKLSKEQGPKDMHEEQFMSRIPYASVVGSLMYAMLYTGPDICFVVGIVSRFQSKLGPDH
ncbi:hypothetical protein ACOSQ2_031551 [Xanthoceras sorbifolium]